MTTTVESTTRRPDVRAAGQAGQPSAAPHRAPLGARVRRGPHPRVPALHALPDLLRGVRVADQLERPGSDDVRRARQLRDPVRRRVLPDLAVQHVLLHDRHPDRPGALAAARAGAQPQDPRPHGVPHHLLRAGHLVAGRDRDRVAVRLQRRLRPDQPGARLVRHRRPRLAAEHRHRQARDHHHGHLEGPRVLDAAVPGRHPGRARRPCTRPPRSTARTRSSGCGTITLPMVRPGDVLPGRHQHHRRVADLHRDQHHDAGRRPGVQLRLDRLVHRPQGVQVPADGLRDGDGDRPRRCSSSSSPSSSSASTGATASASTEEETETQPWPRP